ncbi:hypothetical protein [Desulfovibrio fairfieldensis]|uniref:Uncharacterized protein n=1 Tax=Desulfovibrio fairfieldensis TaxID=44742 RepID=A0A0X8JJC5_9BACT|nr:hypothetical protein [Desulfovibrio fairfieldensis]AMD89843.1 hypothetical protein AXF13_06795 [Desulfovibrio fairfieldensis]DAE69146.1 MAG TPA: hypothetical protein [Bacteriophage sp.]
MSMQRYICIAESLYEDKVSWLAFGIELMNTNPSSAAWRFVECCPKESGAEDFICDEAEPIPVLVKNADTGEVVRVIVEIEWRIAVTEAVIDKSFTPPKE